MTHLINKTIEKIENAESVEERLKLFATLHSLFTAYHFDENAYSKEIISSEIEYHILNNNMLDYDDETMMYFLKKHKSQIISMLDLSSRSNVQNIMNKIYEEISTNFENELASFFPVLEDD